MTAMRSDMVRASSWSWVTKMKVMPTSRWMRFSSSCIDLAQLQVQGAEGLVEQQGLGQVDQGAGERDALLLAAGELVRLALRHVGQAHDLEQLHHAGLDDVVRRLLVAQAERHVLEHVHVGEQRVVLEHGVDVALVGRGARDVLAVQQDPPGGGLFEPGDHPQRGGLAAARRTEHREELALGDVEVGGLDRDVVPEPLAHPVEPDDRVRRCVRGRSPVACIQFTHAWRTPVTIESVAFRHYCK